MLFQVGFANKLQEELEKERQNKRNAQKAAELAATNVQTTREPSQPPPIPKINIAQEGKTQGEAKIIGTPVVTNKMVGSGLDAKSLSEHGTQEVIRNNRLNVGDIGLQEQEILNIEKNNAQTVAPIFATAFLMGAVYTSFVGGVSEFAQNTQKAADEAAEKAVREAQRAQDKVIADNIVAAPIIGEQIIPKEIKAEPKIAKNIVENVPTRPSAKEVISESFIVPVGEKEQNVKEVFGESFIVPIEGIAHISQENSDFKMPNMTDYALDIFEAPAMQADFTYAGWAGKKTEEVPAFDAQAHRQNARKIFSDIGFETKKIVAEKYVEGALLEKNMILVPEPNGNGYIKLPEDTKDKSAVKYLGEEYIVHMNLTASKKAGASPKLGRANPKWYFDAMKGKTVDDNASYSKIRVMGQTVEIAIVKEPQMISVICPPGSTPNVKPKKENKFGITRNHAYGWGYNINRYPLDENKWNLKHPTDAQQSAIVASGTYCLNINSQLVPIGGVGVDGVEIWASRKEALGNRDDFRHFALKDAGATYDWTGIFYIKNDGTAGAVKSEDVPKNKPAVGWKNWMEGGAIIIEGKDVAIRETSTYDHKTDRMAVGTMQNGEVVMAIVKNASRNDFIDTIKQMGLTNAIQMDGSDMAQIKANMKDGTSNNVSGRLVPIGWRVGVSIRKMADESAFEE